MILLPNSLTSKPPRESLSLSYLWVGDLDFPQSIQAWDSPHLSLFLLESCGACSKGTTLQGGQGLLKLSDRPEQQGSGLILPDPRSVFIFSLQGPACMGFSTLVLTQALKRATRGGDGFAWHHRLNGHLGDKASWEIVKDREQVSESCSVDVRLTAAQSLQSMKSQTEYWSGGTFPSQECFNQGSFRSPRFRQITSHEPQGGQEPQVGSLPTSPAGLQPEVRQRSCIWWDSSLSQESESNRASVLQFMGLQRSGLYLLA